MASALAQQLQQTASLNAALFKNAANRINKRDSYLFTPQEASRHDSESIHGFAYNAFLQLESLDPRFGDYEDDLFSEAVKMQDRTLLNPADNEKLNATLDSFLRLLSGHLFIEASSRVLEWLVRHFRIHEFNVDSTVACFLPYHDSPLFVRILAILHLRDYKGPINWAFLGPFKKIQQPLPREALLEALQKDFELLRFVVEMLPKALKEHSAHRALINFYIVTLLAFIKKQKALDENLSAVLLPAFSQILEHGDTDATLGAYMLLVSVSRKTRLTAKALKVLLTNVAKSFRPDVGAAHLISALIAISGSQEELDTVSKKTVAALADIAEIEVWLTECCNILGSEVLLRPLVTEMAAQVEDAKVAATLAALLRSSKLPEPVTSHACLVVARLLAETANEDASLKSIQVKELGALLRQRHPEHFAAAVQSLKAAEDASSIQALESVVAKLTVADHDAIDGEDSYILGAYSADTAVRVSSTRRILESFANKEDLGPDTLSSLCTALLARVADKDVEVLQVLYGEAEKLLDAVSVDDIFTAIKQATSLDLARRALNAHLNFVAKELVKQYPQFADRALLEIFFPHLLFTKSHNRTTASVWEILLESDLAQLPLLRGNADLVRSAIGSSEGDDMKHERLSELNLSVAGKIADNIVVSDHYKPLTQGFLQHLSSPVKYAELLAGLVMRALVARVSGEHQVDLGQSLLELMGNEPLFAVGEAVTCNLAEDVYARPQAARTARQLRIELVRGVGRTGRPLNVKLDFLCEAETVVEEDTRGLRYVTLCRMVYRLASQDGLASPARTQCLRDLLMSLQDSGLTFLAGIGASTSYPSETRASALEHGRAFFSAHNASELTDYQVILPSLLVALGDPSSVVRAAAVKCLRSLAQLYEAGKKAKAIYALDLVYGRASSQLQYLEFSDVTQYIQLLLQHGDELLLDGSTLPKIHAFLAKEKGEAKKLAMFKEKALYFLLSHVAAWRSKFGRESILRSLSSVHSPVKLELLLPLLQEALDSLKDSNESALSDVQGLSNASCGLLVKIFDSTAVPALNDPSDNSFVALKACVSAPLEKDMGKSIYDSALGALKAVFRGLTKERQLDLLEHCLHTIALAEQARSALKQVFSELLDAPALAADLIKSVRPAEETVERSAKRAKIDSSTNDTNAIVLRRLSLLIEIVSSKALPGDINLIVVLLETLGMLMNESSLSNMDVDYTEQLILLAIMNNAAAVPIDSSHAPNNLRIDIIVDLIRSTGNPQTSRQALLTVGSLARLSRESVLHNVMPIFMFMGSSVFQNDDAYTFSVISKTIDSIVPVMAASLKQQHTTRLDLYLRSREFLRVFTDASMHIPRHRRSKFFIHLVDVLGPQEFLAPICMLLVDNVAFRVVKQKPVDVPGSFAVPLACLQKRTLSERVSVLLEILDECQRLCQKLDHPQHSEPTSFLDMSKSIDSHERAPKPEVVITRQIQALLLFVGTGTELLRLPQASDDAGLELPMQQFVSQLLKLTVDPTQGKRDKIISTTALGALDKSMNVVSVPTFAHAVGSMLQTDDAVLQSAAVALLGRLNNITAKARRGIANLMVHIIARLVGLITQSENDSTTTNGLRALETIARTTMAGEENALAQAMGPLIQFASEKQGRHQLLVLNILDLLTDKLGPRLLPNLLSVIELCGAITTGSDDDELRVKAFGVLADVLKELPSFIGSYLPRVLDIALDVTRPLPDAVESSRQALLRAVAKHSKGSTLLPVLQKTWQGQAAGKVASLRFLSMFLQLLTRSLRAAERGEVMAELRPLFKLFLEVFDIRCTQYPEAVPAEFHATEGMALNAFLQLVVKLNESTFKPLFRRLYDWHLEGGKSGRGVVFYRLFGALLDQLKVIITPYMAILFDRTVELLRDYASGKAGSGELWVEVLDVLKKSFQYDEGAFWRDNTMTKIMTPLVDQIDVSARIVMPSYSNTTASDALSSCLAMFCKAASDDTAKAFNVAVWMKARSDSVETKLTMLACAQAIWKRDGERLSGAGYAAETVPFLVECLEDESEAVENEARAFQKQLTKLVGPLDALID